MAKRWAGSRQPSPRLRAHRLAASVGATIEEGNEEVTAELPGGKVWEFSGTPELIASRESGETMLDVWADLVKQMEFGVVLGVV